MENYGIFNDIILSTLEARRNQVMQNTVNRKSQTMMRLEQRVEYETGKDISVKFRKDKLPAGSYEGSEQRPVDSPPLYAGGKIGWKENDVTIKINERDLIENINMSIQDVISRSTIQNLYRGMTQGTQQTMFNLFQGYIEAGIKDHKEEMARQIMLSDGRNPITGNYTDIEGFRVFMNKGKPYAGLDPTDERLGQFDAESIVSQKRDYIWDVKELDLKNEEEVNQLHLVNLASDCRQYGDPGDIYVACSSRHYNAFEYAFEGDKTRQDNSAVRMGFHRNMYIPRLGITIYEETFLKGEHESTLYGWMPDHVKLVKNSKLNFTFSGVMRPIDRNDIVFRYKSMCNLVCSWRAGCFRILNALPGDNLG